VAKKATPTDPEAAKAKVLEAAKATTTQALTAIASGFVKVAKGVATKDEIYAAVNEAGAAWGE
jgi:hypothetical protein